MFNPGPQLQGGRGMASPQTQISFPRPKATIVEKSGK